MTAPEPPVWQDTVRFPHLSVQGAAHLRAMVEHSAAPLLRNRSGHHLTREEQFQIQQFCADEHQARADLNPDNARHWRDIFVHYCRQRVPFYRRYPEVMAFADLPTVSRADLSQDITAFVPDDLPLERLICYTTSGTTGHALWVPSHPRVAARYFAFHRKALHWHGIDLHGDGDQPMAVLLAGFQQRCFTYVSVVPSLADKGLAKLNFHPDDWRDPQDRQRYVDAMQPQLISGDPLSLHELAQIPFQHQPRALLSTSMTLLPGQRAALAQRFGCPVVDLYSMNETGPIAASVPGQSGHRLLQSQLWVEILDQQQRSLPPGQRGEITLTGGFNDYLPLLRYRTGDYARLQQGDDGHWYLLGLEGRAPVRFRTRRGGWLNNVDVTHALQAFALPQFVLRQLRNGDLRLQVRGPCAQAAEIVAALRQLFGADQRIQIEDNQLFEDKVIQYQSELPGAQPL